MNLSFLSFLSEGWFVTSWYLVGACGSLWVMYDLRRVNTALKPAMKWAWPVIVLFFSVIGLALYFLTARAPGIARMTDEKEKKRAHDRFEENPWRRVGGAVIHCVAGDGFGIMTAMVIARASGMTFWQEFWFEYLVGFLIGWLVFQRKSMTMMTDSVPMQLGMAFRAEFFSMLTVMGGMGAVMAFVTPLVATAQPKPLTFAFWGFGALGLLAGFVLTYPMNWLMVKIGWKHGMGGMEGGQKQQVGPPLKNALLAAMTVLGFLALLLPAWLVDVREDALATAASRAPAPERSPGDAAFAGIQASLARSIEGLREGDRTTAALAMDAAMRAAQVGAHSAPGSFYSALEQIRRARLALQDGFERRAQSALETAATLLSPASSAVPPVLDLGDYRGAKVVNASGAVIGQVTDASEGSLELALGGWHDAWGFVDVTSETSVNVRPDALAFGPPLAVGTTLVMLPTEQDLVARR